MNNYDLKVNVNNKFNKELTVLLTSAGGLSGIFLSKHLKENGNYRIVAVDMSELTPLKKWVDAFYTVPSVREKNYIEVLNTIIKKEKIDIIIPITSYDVNLFCKDDIQKDFKNVKMLLMNEKSNKIFSNKRTCYKYLRNIGIKAPEIYNTPETLRFPCVLKPEESSGSKNIIKLDSIEDFSYWSNKIENFLVCEYLEGREFTVDCLFDNNGKCLGANVRERVKAAGGGATITKNEYSHNIEEIIEKLEMSGIVRGPINFQYKKVDNEYFVFDFNTRFASGGLPLTVKSGFDIPNMLIKLLSNEKVSRWYPVLENDGLTMIRYYEEYYKF